MSKYTTEVRFICENYAGLEDSVGFTDVKQTINASREKIFEHAYPIFDENYRPTLENKILSHYYTREICEETVGLWKLRLQNRMNEIMPYYNKMYESELLEFDPFNDTDYVRTGHNEGTFDGEVDTNHSNNGSGTNDANNWDVFSDTPQSSLDGVGQRMYYTNATNTTIDSENTFENSGNNNTVTDNENTNDYWETVKGKRGSQSYASLLNELRNTFLNIDALIIDELKDLFFGLWD